MLKFSTSLSVGTQVVAYPKCTSKGEKYKEEVGEKVKMMERNEETCITAPVKKALRRDHL